MLTRISGAAAVSALAFAAAAFADDDVRFYDEETFTIVFEQTGQMDAGAVTEHVRNWGTLRVEIKDTQTSFMGVSQTTNQRVIYDQDQIITIDNTTGSLTIAENPMWDGMVSSMDGQSGVEVGQQWLTAMGGVQTGETGSFAGYDCGYWEVASLSSNLCVTSWGATLYSATSMMGMSTEKTATEVIMGDGGPDEAFEYDPDAAQTVPNLQDLLNQMGGG